MEWIVRSGEDEPSPPDGYVVSFIPFHERGFATPPHRFLQGLLHHYGIELQHLNPNGIQHISAFFTLCEGYLGIEPHFELWKYFFTVDLQKKERKKPDLAVVMGCVSICLRGSQPSEYMPIPLSKSNKGWHKLWFYLRNDAAAPYRSSLAA